VSLRDSATPSHPRALLDDGQRARRADPARRRIGSRSTTRAAMVRHREDRWGSFMSRKSSPITMLACSKKVRP
jgi:hypothetical protein